MHAMILLLLLACTNVMAGEFVADFKEHESWEAESAKEQTGRIFVKTDKSRMEFFRDGQTIEILIVNPAKRKSWFLNAEKKTYMEIEFKARSWKKVPVDKDKESLFKIEYLGTESISGHVCEKLRYVFLDKSLGETI